MIRFEVSLVISGRHHQLLLVPRPSIDLLRIDELRAEDFEDEKDKNGNPPSGVDPSQSPPVKQPKKRVKRAKKPKALPASSEKGDDLPPPEEPAPAPKTKPARRVRSKAPQPSQPAAESAQPSQPKEGEEKPKRLPGKGAQEVAMVHMQEAKADPAEWMHVEKLVKAMGDKYTCKADTPRFDNWSFSMYWKTNRVGVLQKREGGHVHVVSFGTSYTQHIGMSVKAACMYVGSLVA